MLNLLTQYLGEGAKNVPSIPLDWIGEIIKWLIGGVGIVGLGIIVFTLILKTIVLPFDIWSRVKSKKQALIMEEMRPQMEKLQKQYANDKDMYAQKVRELQKKSGSSMLGACLPMIISLVIFIVVFNSFSLYSRYQNLENYKGMVNAYNGAVATFVIDDENPDGFLDKVYFDNNGKIVTANETSEIKTDEYGNVTKIDGVAVTVKYEIKFDAFVTYYNTEKQSTLSSDDVFGELMAAYKKKYPKKGAISEGYEKTEEGKCSLVAFYTEEPAAEAAAKYYREHKQDLFGIPFISRNIWYPDSMLSKEVPDFSTFKSTVRYDQINDGYLESYNKVTANLSAEKGTYNGYFILILLSIGGMLLQQFISMRANKSTNELSSVDGSAAKTNKYMMIIMPIMYGVFAFFYSAAFSIYMVTNTVYSIITSLIINKITDVVYKKKRDKAETEAFIKKNKRRQK